jgi:hypothetical protein
MIGVLGGIGFLPGFSDERESLIICKGIHYIMTKACKVSVFRDMGGGRNSIIAAHTPIVPFQAHF